MKNLNREINLNKKFILILVFVCILSIGFYSSYAYFQIRVIKNNVVVIQTASISVTTEVVGSQNQTFTLGAGETKTVTVNLTSTANGEIAYKMYYELTSGSSTFDVTSTEIFPNEIVEGVMNQSKTLTFTFENTGSSSVSIKLGTQGGLASYPITLEQGVQLVVKKPTLSGIIQASVEKSTCNPSIVEDGITYLSGTNDCVNFNYIWYSGKLWRITAVYSDGTMKMITDDTITAISYGNDVNFYTDASNKSYVYQWLNEDFLDTLYNYQNIIVTDSKWNATNSNASSTTAISTKLPETTMVTAPVGLLNSYEYYMSYKNTKYSSDYLNIGYTWWLLNPYSSSNLWYVDEGGYADGYNVSPSEHSYGIRPSVRLKSTIELTSGKGTKDDPYRIPGDKEEATANTTLLNSRTSGEYVTFDGELYRIVSIEGGKTKINKNDYIVDESDTVLTKMFSNNAVWGSGTSTDDYWDYYLINTWYNSISSTYKNMMVSGTYYVGKVTSHYKEAVCATASNTITTKDCTKTTSTWTGYVGLPEYGEMFGSLQESSYSSLKGIWLINPGYSVNVCEVSLKGKGFIVASSNTACARPSIYLNSTVKITGGEGTKKSPFELRLS